MAKDIGGIAGHPPQRADHYDCCLIASDLHVLSTFALLRPGFVTTEGNEVGVNRLQEWLWSQFLSCVEEVKQLANGRPFPLILNGDLLEGNHHRTTEILAADEVEHARASVYTLQPLTDIAAESFVVEGTECHTGNLEHYIAKEIGATPSPDGKYAWPLLHISIHDCLGSVRHHISTTSREWLGASGIGINAANAQLAAARAGQPIPKWIASGHRHKPGLVTDGYSHLAVVSPAWQGLTRYARKVVPDGQLVVGFVWLDWRGSQPGALPAVKMITRTPEPKEVAKR